MLSINKQYQINTGTAPYTYTWVLNNCISSTSGDTGTTNLIISTDFNYVSEDCLTPPSLHITDVNGCEAYITDIEITNPCTSLDIELKESPFQFGSSIEGTLIKVFINGSFDAFDEYEYEWYYDNILFTDGSIEDGSQLDLLFEDNIQVPSTTIRVVIRDRITGCTHNESIVLQFEPVESIGIELDLCRGQSSNFCIISDIINYENVQFVFQNESNVGEYFTITHVEDNCYNIISNTEGVAFQGRWYIIENGINTGGNINVRVQECGANLPSQLTGINQCIHIDCEDLTTSNTIVDLDDYIYAGACPIDWTTFQFIPNPSQTLNSNTSINGQFGTVEFNSDHQLILNLNDYQPYGAELFCYRILDECGNTTGELKLTLSYSCPVAPYTFPDEFCLYCGEPLTFFDVLVNDTGDIDVTSIQLSNLPDSSVATLSTNSLGQVGVLLTSGYSGTFTFDYTVANNSGIVSQPTTITIKVDCAGSGATITTKN